MMFIMMFRRYIGYLIMHIKEKQWRRHEILVLSSNMMSQGSEIIGYMHVDSVELD